MERVVSIRVPPSSWAVPDRGSPIVEVLGLQVVVGATPRKRLQHAPRAASVLVEADTPPVGVDGGGSVVEVARDVLAPVA